MKIYLKNHLTHKNGGKTIRVKKITKNVFKFQKLLWKLVGIKKIAEKTINIDKTSENIISIPFNF